MSYTDDAVLSKLSSLNETQESIVTVAQWLMFHRRHADRTANLWMQRLQSSTSTAKRLNLIYLANDVVQQSRARGKNDFLIAFEPIVGEAMGLAYRSASQDVQGKLKRVVQVWRERKIFDPSVQDAVERRIKEIDDSRGGGGINGVGGSGRKLGGSLFGGSGNVPAELEAASKAQGGLSEVEGAVKPAVDKANEEYAKMTNPDTPTPTAPVHAAKLNTLIKHLAAAQGAVEASMTARKELLAELDKLVESNRAKLAEDETTSTDLATRKENIEAKKREVEDNIMRGLSTPTSPESVATPDATGDGGAAASNGASKKRSASKEIERPEAEGFTPPPPDVESFTPPPTLQSDALTEAGDVAPIFDQSEFDAQINDQYGLTSTTGAEPIHELPPQFTEPPPAFEPAPALPATDVATNAAAAANEFLNNLNVHQKVSRQASSEMPAGVGAGVNGSASPTTSDPRLKRRKLSHKDEMDGEMFGTGAVGGVDEEGVSALLNG